MDIYKMRRLLLMLISALLFMSVIIANTKNIQTEPNKPTTKDTNLQLKLAIDELDKIQIKGRAPKTDYTRDKFGSGWAKSMGCDTRNIILNRDLFNVSVDINCNVTSGILNDPYTGKVVDYSRVGINSGTVQIDHVVALSDAWQKGAQQFSLEKRITFANDPLELLAVSSESNMQKSDGDAATWLPSNKQFRCQYVSRQIAVKIKYNLWITKSEHEAMKSVLSKCPEQMLPNP